MKQIILSLLGTVMLLASLLRASICFAVDCYVEGIAIILITLALIYIIFSFFLKRKR